MNETEAGTSSPSPAQMRRRILSQAVEENVSERQGKRPKPPSPHATGPQSQRRASRWPWILPALLVVALLPLLRQAPVADAEASPGAAPTPAEPAEINQPVIATPVFDAPQPIDFSVFPLAVERIVIDPGHGGEDAGTTGGGLTEKDLTLDIAFRLREQLEEQGFEVFMTREDDQQISLRQRALQANSLRADLFVSIHINWIAERTVRGLETYFLGGTDDPMLEALARKENRGSGYSLADMKSLLEGIYTGVRQGESHQFAEHVQKSLYRSLLRQNPQLANRGVKQAPFVVLVATEMPAILAEVSCLSNEQEAKLLARPLYRQHIAEALSRGIRSYADEVHQSEAKGS